MSSAACSSKAADRIRAFYLAVAPELFGTISQKLGAKGLVRPDTRVIMEKPIGSDLASAIAVNDAVGRVFERAPDLPDRPLPRQRDRAEPDGAQVRQRPVRAAVERRPCRPRADYGRRKHRGGRARRLLRPHRGAARHGAEPPVAIALPGRHGAADAHGRRLRARREAEGAARAQSDRRRATPPT